LTLAGCFAHVRRGFFEALEQAPKQAGWVLLQIGHLYSIERKLRRQGAGAVLRQADRASQSRMIYARIHRVLKRWQRGGRTLPQSALGKAISYALGQWESLEVYLKDGTIEIDNNLVENAIRPRHLEKRTGCFSAMPKPETAAPYSTPSSNPVADAAWNLSPTCAIC
jgi:transposase